MTRKISRRQFVKGGVAAGASLLLAPCAIIHPPGIAAGDDTQADAPRGAESRVVVVTDHGAMTEVQTAGRSGQTVNCSAALTP